MIGVPVTSQNVGMFKKGKCNVLVFKFRSIALFQLVLIQKLTLFIHV